LVRELKGLCLDVELLKEDHRIDETGPRASRGSAAKNDSEWGPRSAS